MPRFVNLASGRNSFSVQFVGMVTSNYIIQASSNLINWVPVMTNASLSGITTYTETNRFNRTNRFFRAVTPPPGPGRAAEIPASRRSWKYQRRRG